MVGLNKWTDWSVPGLLYKLEGYNGFGYRNKHPEVLSPYLWSFSNHYSKGKFVADGTWSPVAVSKQCGAAVLLRRMSETGAITFNAVGVPIVNNTVPAATTPPATTTTPATTTAPAAAPLVQFSTKKKSPLAEELQNALNKFPGIFVKPDGIAGQKTSDAVMKVLGHFLLGDPRA